MAESLCTLYMKLSAGIYRLFTHCDFYALAPIEPSESASLRVTISRLFNHEQVLVSVASGPWITNYHGFCHSTQRVVLVCTT